MKTKLYLILSILIACTYTGIAQNTVTDSLIKQANIQASQGDVNGSTANLLAAQKMAEAANNTQLLCKIYIVFGKLGLISQNNQAVSDALDKADNYCNACKDTLSLARIKLQRGVMLIKNQDFDAAINTFKQSAQYYLIGKDTAGAANAKAKIGNVLERQGLYAEAQPYYLDFYEVSKKNPESTQFLTANIYLTGNYLYLSQGPKALFHNDITKKLAKQLNASFEYSNALRYDALIYAQMGDYKEAFYYLSDVYLRHYQDTLMSEQRLQETEELKAKYEDEKKEAQIALQNAQLSEANYKFWALTGGLALALIAGALLFLLARRLRKRNEEKEFLIKEIHHRVKNNLQILSSLLHLQSRQITDDTALDAVREGQSRVDAMGLIHQKLYMGDNVAKVEMKDYFEQFGQNMLDSFGKDDGSITMHYDMDPLYLDVDTAIPMGLIVNELVTNSLKYAFPEQRAGNIHISLRKDDKNRLLLKVSDDGVGAKAAPTLANSTSFGASLVQMLSKKLKGKVEVETGEMGYATVIRFE